MSLKQTINADFITAFKAKETEKKDALGLIKTRIAAVEKEKKVDNLSDDEVIAILKNLAKQRKQTIDMLEGQSEGHVLLEKEKRELALIDAYLEKFMPAQLSEGETIHIVTELLQNGENLGGVMKHFKENYNGRYDAKSLSGKVNSLLKAK